MFNSRFAFLVLVLLFVLVAPFAVVAQDDEPTVEPTLVVTLEPDQPPPVEEPAPDVPEPIFVPPPLQTVMTGLFLAALSYFATAIASPLTSQVVNLLKRVPFLADVKGDQLNLLVAVLLSGGYYVAEIFGYTGQISTFYEFMLAVLPFVTGIAGNYSGNRSVYKMAQKQAIPIASFARTPETQKAA